MDANMCTTASADSQVVHPNRPRQHKSPYIPSPGRTWLIVTLILVLAVALTACSETSRNGGNADEPTQPPASPQSLKFTYPFNGQQDVPLGTQIVATFGSAVTSNTNAFELAVIKSETNPDPVQIDVVQDNKQQNIYRIQPVSANGDPVQLAPETTYAVRLDGDKLFQFKTRPIAGSPAGDEGFKVVARSPGTSNPAVSGQTLTLPLTEFNAIRLRLSAPVNPNTVIKGKTFTFTTAAGQPIKGRLTALGRYITFDPLKDLDSGKTYNLTLKAPAKKAQGVMSAFGEPLASTYTDTLTPMDNGDVDQQSLKVRPTSQSTASLPANPLNGLTTNLAMIQSQLVGVNTQSIFNANTRGGLATTLAYGPTATGVFPGVVRSGQKVQLEKFVLKLSKDPDSNAEVDTPIKSGPINGIFINDADVYLLPNQLRDGIKPTAVRLRFDLGIATGITASNPHKRAVQSLANGVFNQTVMNVQAAGTAKFAEDGSLIINAITSFPIKVNRTDTATINMELRMVLPPKPPANIGNDTTPPVVTAQFPSACLYAFGSPNYYAVYEAKGASPTSLPEMVCTDSPKQGAKDPIAVTANSFPVGGSPSIVFSEPLEPTTVSNDSVSLLANGTAVPSDVRVEGASIVIDPKNLLEPKTDYTIKLGTNATITDLAGNALTASKDITFQTEPIANDDSPAAPLLSTVTPGIPCILEGGTFRSQGSNKIAGHCAGDARDFSGSSSPEPFPVFEHPADLTVDAFFSKLVQADTIKLANGCLAEPANQDAAATNKGTVSIQIMEGGQCVDVVPGKIAFGSNGHFKDKNEELTNSFSFRPAHNLEVGQRYWIVVTNDIKGVDGKNLNTNPLKGTGSTVTPGPQTDTDSSDDPNVVIPFDASPTTKDYYVNLLTVPFADTNGNGQFDDAEVAQPANSATVNMTVLDGNVSLGSFPAYLSLVRPVAIRNTVAHCKDDIFTDAVNLKKGGDRLTVSTPACIKVSLLPGGISAFSSINLGVNTVTGALKDLGKSGTLVGDIPVLGPLLGGLGKTLGAVTDAVEKALLNIPDAEKLARPIQTGRVLLRFPPEAGEGGPSGVAQSGYLVKKCSGQFPNGQKYAFEPCFVATLSLIANAPDSQLVTLAQQKLKVTIAGPATFEQNGRLIISLTNLNKLTLDAEVSLGSIGLLPAKATIKPTNLKFQVTGQAIHGGRAFPVR